MSFFSLYRIFEHESVILSFRSSKSAGINDFIENKNHFRP